MQFEELKSECLACQKCELSKTRKNVVFGKGVENAEVLFIGEAPGQNEDEQGMPFVGRSGKLLDEYLKQINLSWEKNIFIANTIKCRPPENRNPSKLECEACMPYLEKQIDIISPKIIVCLGSVAAKQIMRADFKIMKEHGVFEKRNNIWYMAMLHPAALLRNPNNKPLAKADFQILQNKINEVCVSTYLTT